jgi:hypothetical protein
MSSNVKIDLRGFDKLKRLSDANNQTGPVGDMFRKIGTRYLAFVNRRFIQSSRGGGDWTDLAESTKKQRRTGKAKGKVGHAILRNTGTLLNALSVGAAGNIFKRRGKTLEVGIGGPSRHPDSKATIGDIASFHDQGGKNLPQRQIIVQPDARTRTGMERDVQRAIDTMLKQSKI